MGVVSFPLSAPGDICSACETPIAGHRLNGRWIGCKVDPVVGRDQHALARRLRLARLQTRALKVHPFGVDLDAMETR